jgi:membrane protein YqaA with SNARE-associated domain
MRNWVFRSNGTTADSGDDSEATRKSRFNGIIKQSQFLTDVQDSLPEASGANAKRLLVGLLLFFLCMLGLFVLLRVAYYYWEIQDTGYAGVFLANFVFSSGVILPLPFSGGALVTIAVAGAGNPAFLVGLVAAVGGTLGEFTAYWLGRGGERFIHLRGSHQYEVAERWMGRYGGLTIVFFAFMPFFMFDFVGIAAGALRYPFTRFLVFCFVGRLPRCLLEAFVGMTIVDMIISQLPWLPEWIRAPFD